MSKITYQTKYQKISIEDLTDEGDHCLTDLMDYVVKPLIFALGYLPESLNEYFIEEGADLQREANRRSENKW